MIMRKYFLTLISIITFISLGEGQKVINGVVTYGDEWIDLDKQYLKMRLAEDGIYKVSYSELADSGFPVSTTPMSQYQVFNLGKEIAIKTSTEGIPTDGDYMLFYGLKNRSEVDRYGFKNDDHILNPRYSLISDTSAYFLTINESPNSRFQEVYTEVEDLNLPSPDYFIFKDEHVYTNRLFDPSFTDSNVSYSDLRLCEGYSMIQKQTLTQNLNIHNLYKEAGDLKLHLRGATNKSSIHFPQLSIDDNVVYSDTLSQFELIDIKTNINANSIGSKLKVELQGLKETTDLNTISIIELTYPRQLSAINSVHQFKLYDGNFSLALNNDSDYLLDVGNNKIIYKRDGKYKTFSDSKSQFAYSDGGEKTVEISSYKQYPNIYGESFDYLIITNSDLFKNSNVLSEYDQYRSSAEGGGYDTYIVDVNDLYDMYAYGVDRHFVSINNFGFKLFVENPDLGFVLLLGKAVQYSQNRSVAQVSSRTNFVPTFGVPGSDNLLFTNFDSRIPWLALGRISANTAEEVSWYLDKVKGYDAQLNLPQTIEDKFWMKSMMHLSGGGINDYQNAKRNLDQMATIIEDGKVGAEVTSYYKYNDESPNESFLDETLDRINNGLLIISQFGHGAVSTIDFSIENPDKFNNKDRYHLLMSYGCLTGNCHTAGGGLSEEYIINKDKGSIGFLATSGYAYPSNLGAFGKNYYEIYGKEFYGKTVGETIHAALDSIDYGASLGIGTFLQQWTLHGDPAVTLYHFDNPDYIMDYKSTHNIPQQLNAFNKEADICVDIYNLGEGIDGNLKVDLKHYREDGSLALDSIYTVSAPKNKDNYCFKFPLGNTSYIGKNRIELILNPNNTIVEGPMPSAEGNNSLVSSTGTLGFEFNVLSDNALATYPYNYEIVNSTEVELVATTFNAFADSSSYIMELDTTPEFNSPYLKNHRTISKSPISWNISIPETENQVYYWRVSTDTLRGDEKINVNWDLNSFTYKSGQSGWSQGHWGQLDDNEMDRLRINADRELEFTERNRIYQIKNSLEKPAEIYRDGGYIDIWRRTIPKGIGLVPIFKNTSKFEPNDRTGKYNSAIANRTTVFYEYIMDTPDDRAKLYDAISNNFEDKYVLITTLQKINKGINFDEWQSNGGKDFIQFLRNHGSTLADELEDMNSFVYNAVMDGKTKVILSEEYGLEDVTSNFELMLRWDVGNMTTQAFGPNLDYSGAKLSTEIIRNDSINCVVLGSSDNNEYTEILNDINTNGETDLSSINPYEYPFIKVQCYFEDLKENTPSAISEISIQGIPSNELFLVQDDNLIKSYQYGEPVKIPVRVNNINSTLNALVDINLDLSDQNNQKINKVISLETLNGGISSYQFNIDSLLPSGSYLANLEVNKNRNIIEHEYRNNSAQFAFEVEKNKEYGLLNVTFDGIHIMNNDIVSSQPDIKIELESKGGFLLIEDPSMFKVKLVSPDGSSQIIDLDSDQIEFIPATELNNNKASVHFRPTDLSDGEYTLLISTESPYNNTYEVTFRVINKNAVSNFINYPNPFSTSTQFIFTLTGHVIPSNLVLRIYTVSGKIVREITGDELGSLHIGMNKTDFRWDGTDEYGNKLANGTYLYKVFILDDSGKDYEKIDLGNNTDQYFNSGFGKMTIIR